MIEGGLSARSIRYTHAVLRSALRQAVGWQLLLNDPTKGVHLPRQPHREMRVLTTKEARTFLNVALISPHRCVFALALTTGMRPSEYLALCWQDIDWERGTVSVVRTLERSKAQRRFAETKRTRSGRVVKLQSWVLNLLKNLRNKRGEGIPTGDPKTQADLVFTTALGEPITAENSSFWSENANKLILRSKTTMHNTIRSKSIPSGRKQLLFECCGRKPLPWRSRPLASVSASVLCSVGTWDMEKFKDRASLRQVQLSE
jgi:integrase